MEILEMDRSKEASLAQVFAEHLGNVSDKWSSYITTYDRLLTTRRDERVRVLEIGVQNGGSLEVWSKYFPNIEQIVGIDCNVRCKDVVFGDDRISVVIADAANPAAAEQVLKISPTFDIIIDDGSHKSADIIRTFSLFFQYLPEGGIYIIEDLHCSYWDEFQGGLYHPYSSLAFLKSLVDLTNKEHWGIPLSRKALLSEFASEYSIDFDEASLNSIHSVEFLNSLCVIRKKSPAENLLGKRQFSGRTAHVVPSIANLGSSVPIRDETKNSWSQEINSPANQLRALSEKIDDAIRDMQLQTEDLRRTRQELNDCHSQLDFLVNTLSWRLTAPFRALCRLISGDKQIVGHLTRT